MLLLLIKLFMHSYLTEMKIQNFTDILEHLENIKGNLVGLNLEILSLKKKKLRSRCQRICPKKLGCWFCAKETKYLIKSETI